MKRPPIKVRRRHRRRRFALDLDAPKNVLHVIIENRRARLKFTVRDEVLQNDLARAIAGVTPLGRKIVRELDLGHLL